MSQKLKVRIILKNKALPLIFINVTSEIYDKIMTDMMNDYISCINIDNVIIAKSNIAYIYATKY